MRALLVLLAISTLACSDSTPSAAREPEHVGSSKAAPPPAAHPEPAGVASPAPPTEPQAPTNTPPKAGDTVEVHGITVKFVEGGAIEIHGTDRWGAKLDTTYESAEYLRNALPTLERSISPEQASGLKALVP